MLLSARLIEGQAEEVARLAPSDQQGLFDGESDLQ